MSEPKLLILGTPRVQSTPVPRLELHVFVHPNNIKQYSLYIQALQDFYGRDISKVSSYFQVSAIHGKPYSGWNHSPSPPNQQGYCVHGTPVFATWHRPYVALFEQEIQKIAVKFANQYAESEKADWILAAQSLRQPYWAWDADATMTPPDAIIVDKEVEIIKPNVGRVKVPNPFYSYQFPLGVTEKYFDKPFDARHTTLRHPSSNTQSNPNLIKNFLKDSKNRDNIRNRVRTALSANNWEDFTTRLESVHGDIHALVGGRGNDFPGVAAGHMNFIPYAAFDPSFWAHHCQVDRLVQAWYTTHNRWETSDRDLTPFWNTDTTYWKSPAITNTDATFNYSSAPLQPSAPKILENVSAVVKSAPKPQAPLVAHEETHTWSVCISAKKFEIGGSFTVFVFLGNIPTRPEDWVKDPGYAGVFSFFVNSEPEKCGNCTHQTDTVVRDFVYLNASLEGVKALESLRPGHVCDFLSQKDGSHFINLNWAVSTADGRIVHGGALDNHIPSLDLCIGHSPGHREGFGLRPKSYFPEVTRHRPGGAKG